MASSSSSSNPSCVSGEYDVFLSFRGEDTRKTIVGHLYGALDRLGFRIFKDDEKLQRGKCISSELFYYINHSKIAVIIFSENYTTSSWCLDELVEIMDCQKKKKQIVLPIFYHVKPSLVRKQKRSFFEAFGKYVFYSQQMKKLERQRAALKEAANISGFELQVAANGDEAEFIEQIVGEIFQKLQPQPFSEELPSLEELHLTGCGTLVEVKLDNMKLKILDLSWCENLKHTPNLSVLPCLEKLNLKSCTSVVEIHPSIEFHERLVHLDLKNCKNLKNLATRINLISLKRLRLSGCSKLEKFPDLQGDVECFKSLFVDGTAIKELSPPVAKHLQGLLRLNLMDCKMLERLPNNIGEMKSLQLLRLEGTAIKDLPPSISLHKRLRYLHLSNCKMLGSLPSNIEEMKSLEELYLRGSGIKDLPPSISLLKGFHLLDVRDCKMIGGLPSNIGEMKSLTVLYLKGSGIKELPSSISHLEGLRRLNMTDCRMLGSLPSNIGEMKSLRELYLSCSRIKKLPSSISHLEGLYHLDVRDCRMLGSLPSNIGEMKSLRTIYLRGSGIKELPSSISHLEGLRHLDMTYCRMLGSLPSNIGEMKSLKELYLSCSRIKKLPSSISHLEGLYHLDATNCKMLESLPSNIGEMESLRELSLGGSGIKELPSSISHLKWLEFLNMRDCKMLGSLPSNIGEMKSLSELWLGGSGIKDLPSSIVQLTKLIELKWGSCNLDEKAIQNLPHSLSRLNLRENNFVSLPESFTHLTNLRELTLDDCLSLQTLDSLPSSISHLSAQGCVSLQHYSIPSNDWESLNFSGSHKLAENQGNNKPNIYCSQTQPPKNGKIVLPGSEIPSWFSHRYESVQMDEDMTNSVSLRMDDLCSFGCIKEICVCAVFEIEDDDEKPLEFLQPLDLDFHINGSSVGSIELGNQIDRFKTDHIVLMRDTYDQSGGVDVECNSDGSYTKASIRVSKLVTHFADYGDDRPVKVKVKKWGLHLVMDGTNRLHQSPANKDLFSAPAPKR